MKTATQLAEKILAQTSKRDIVASIKQASRMLSKYQYTRDGMLEVMRAIVDSLDKLAAVDDKKKGISSQEWLAFGTAVATLGAGAIAIFQLAMEEERKRMLALEEERQRQLALEEERKKALALEEEQSPKKVVEDRGPLALTEQAAPKSYRKKTPQISEDTQENEELRREADEAPAERLRAKKGSKGEPSRRKRRPPLP